MPAHKPGAIQRTNRGWRATMEVRGHATSLRHIPSGAGHVWHTLTCIELQTWAVLRRSAWSEAQCSAFMCLFSIRDIRNARIQLQWIGIETLKIGGTGWNSLAALIPRTRSSGDGFMANRRHICVLLRSWWQHVVWIHGGKPIQSGYEMLSSHVAHVLLYLESGCHANLCPQDRKRSQLENWVICVNTTQRGHSLGSMKWNEPVMQTCPYFKGGLASFDSELANFCVNAHRKGVFTLGGALSFSGLTSKIPPIGCNVNFAMLNFDDRASPMWKPLKIPVGQRWKDVLSRNLVSAVWTQQAN